MGGVHDAFKSNLPIANLVSEGLNSLGPRPSEAYYGELGLGNNLGCGKKVCESTGSMEGLPESSYHPTRDHSCRPDGKSLLGSLFTQQVD
jgi:hypothetical protein